MQLHVNDPDIHRHEQNCKYKQQSDRQNDKNITFGYLEALYIKCSDPACFWSAPGCTAKLTQEDWNLRWELQCNSTCQVHIHSLPIPSCPPDLRGCSWRGAGANTPRWTSVSEVTDTTGAAVQQGNRITQCKVKFAKYVHRSLSIILQLY